MLSGSGRTVPTSFSCMEVSLSLFCPYVVYESKSEFVGTNGTAYDVEYSTPFIEDEGGAAHA